MANRTESTGTKTITTESVLQEELQDLRSMAVHADHLRWITRGDGSDSFDELVHRLSEEWRMWAENVACYLIDHGTVPDGRVSSLTEGTYRGWLPGDWLEMPAASEWLTRELDVHSSWTDSRIEQVDDEHLRDLLATIREGLARELSEFKRWLEPRQRLVDVVDEAGIESFPASDSPTWWAGGSAEL